MSRRILRLPKVGFAGPNEAFADLPDLPQRVRSGGRVLLSLFSQTMSNDTPSSVSSREHTAAFLLLRLFLGLRALLAGLEKFESGGNYSFEIYYRNMARMANGITSASFMPLWATKTFAFFLGYVLIALGLALLLGVRTRCALTLLGLTWVGLSFGLMAVQENEGVAWLAIYVGLTAGALLLVRHNRFALWSGRS